MKVTIGGEEELRCLICKQGEFEERRVLLNSRFMTWLGWDWLNRATRAFVCLGCGYVHQFLARQKKEVS